MASTHAGTPLGVGSIISESFSILFKNIVTVMILGFFPTLLTLVIGGLLMGWGVALGGAEPDFTAEGVGFGFVVAIILQVGIYGMIIALLVQMAYNAKLGRPQEIGRYFGPALRSAFPIVILTTVAGLLTGIGAVFLVIPGLWIYAVFSVIVPAIVIERAGFGAMGRSAKLTKEYRWPVLGTLLLIGIVTAILSAVVAFVFSAVSAIVGGGAFGIAVSVIVNAALYAVSYGLSGIAVSLIYARLREIKEGVGVDALADVFD